MERRALIIAQAPSVCVLGCADSRPAAALRRPGPGNPRAIKCECCDERGGAAELLRLFFGNRTMRCGLDKHQSDVATPLLSRMFGGERGGGCFSKQAGALGAFWAFFL